MAAHLVDVVAHQLGHAVGDRRVEELVELGDVEAPSPAADAACAVAEAELTEAPVRTPACAHREWITRSF